MNSGTYALSSMQNCLAEIELTSQTAYADPLNDVEVSVIFEDPDGASYEVPAFWAGHQTWKARYASPLVGISDMSRQFILKYHARALTSVPVQLPRAG